MLIRNSTQNNPLEVKVAGMSSKTLWHVKLDAQTSAEKVLGDDDAPFTVTAKWQDVPNMQYNFVTGSTGNVPHDRMSVDITLAYPEFHTTVK